MTLLSLALLSLLSISSAAASEVAAPIAGYGSVTLIDSNKGVQLRISLNAPPFTMYSFRLVNNCQQQTPEHHRTRQPVAGSVITNREGTAQSVRTFHRQTLQQLHLNGLNAVVFYVHDYNNLRFLSCSELKPVFNVPEFNLKPNQESPLR